MNDDVATLVRDAASQTKFANTLWVTLVVIALYVLLPPSSTSGTRPLPFGLGNVPSGLFYLVATLLLAVFFIAFASAHAQIARAHLLAQASLDRSVSSWIPGKEIHPRDLWDVTVTPSLNRVAPVTQAWRGPYQFHASPIPCPKWLARLTTVFYLYLKVLALFLYWGLPSIAFVLAAREFFRSQSPVCPALAVPLVCALFIGVVIAVPPVFWLEVGYIRRARQQLLSR